jgi:hypothetical protein
MTSTSRNVFCGPKTSEAERDQRGEQRQVADLLARIHDRRRRSARAAAKAIRLQANETLPMRAERTIATEAS